MARPGRLRSALVNASLAIASSALFLGALEGLARRFEKTSPDETAEKLALWDKVWKSDFYLLTSHSPGWPPGGAVNREGLPDRLHPEPRLPGTYRIAVLGDSVTAGTPFKNDESWPYHLRELADERGGVVEIMNVALWGWSTRQQATAYRTIVRRYRPDSVVVGLCLNDIEELQNNLSRPVAVLGWLHRRFALVRRLVNADGRSIQMVEELLLESPNVNAGFARLFAELSRLESEVRADGASLTLVVLPMQSQASGRSSSRLPQERIAAYCQRKGIGFVDPLPALAGRGDLFEDVVHLTPEGRVLLAAALFEPLVPKEQLAQIDPRSDTEVRAALSSPKERDRAEAAWALGRRGATDTRLGGLLRDPSPLVRANAAAALGRLGPDARFALTPLLTAMDDAEIHTRWRATAALVAAAPDGELADAVARHLTSRDFYVRSGAAFALQQMGPAASDTLPALRALLSDPDEGVRAMAVQAVASVARGDASSLAAFLAILDGPTSEGNARWKAARAIGRLGSSAVPAIPSLAKALSDPNGHVRREAASALGRIGEKDEGTLSALAAASRDEWPPVRRAAAGALGRLGCGHEPSLAALGVLESDGADEVRVAARSALGECGTGRK